MAFESPTEAGQNQNESENSHDTRGRKTSSRASSWLKSVATAAALFMHPAGGSEAEASPNQESMRDNTHNAGEVGANFKEGKSQSDWTYEVYHTFFKKDAQGNEVFNPSALLFPLEVVATKTETKNNVAEVVIPYQYARLYDSAKSVDPEAAHKTKEFIKSELLNQLGESVHSWGWLDPVTDGVIQDKRPLASSLSSVKSVKIVGHSSPEGRTPDSLIPGHIEPENVNLALKRAQDAGKMMPSEIPQEVMDKAFFSGDEAQFTDEDLEELGQVFTEYVDAKRDAKKGISTDHSGVRLSSVAELQRELFETVQDYNAGKMDGHSDPAYLEAKQVLDKVLAGKRTVNIEVEGEQGKKDTYVIPVPNLLFLLLIPLLRRRNRNVPPVIPEPELIEDIIPEPLPFSLIPENVESGEFWMARYNTLRDIYTGFDNMENVEGGINYRRICEQLEVNFNRFATDEDRITWLSHHILDQWMDYDAKKLNVDRVTLNYKNEAHQLMYARLHAEELFEAVEDHIRPHGGTAHDDYMLTIWGNYTEAYNEIAGAVIHPQEGAQG